jgi:hypothetical protein
MSYHNYISRNIFVSFLAIASLLTSSMGVSAQEPDGLCCDPDGTNYAGVINCLNSGCCGSYDEDGCVEDAGCTNYATNPCIIPIEDGIPFLIIAGGVFAYYRLREKKERVVTEA